MNYPKDNLAYFRYEVLAQYTVTDVVDEDDRDDDKKEEPPICNTCGCGNDSGNGQTIVTATPNTLGGFIYTRSEYNAKGQLTKQYQDTGSGTESTAPTLYEYDNFGNLTKQTLALSAIPTKDNSPVVEMAYNVESTDEGVFSVTTNTRYNAEGNPLVSMQKLLISNLSNAEESKNLTIDERNLTTTQWVEYHVGTKRKSYNTLPTSNITAEAVTVDGFTLSQTDNAGRSSTANGMIHTRTDGRGNTITTVTDKAGRTLTVTDAAGNVTTTVYGSAHDLPATVTDAQGNTSCYRYDARGRKLAEWGTGIQPVCFGYDDADRMTSLTTFRASAETVSTDPSDRTDGDTTTWSYHDTSGMETAKTYADNSSVAKTYDAYNRVLTETDARGKVKAHTYEQERGLLLGTSYSDSSTPRAYTYNHLGQLTQVTDAAGVRTLSYNTYGEQESDSLVADNVTHLITETRDDKGRSTGYTYAKNGTVQQTVTTGYGSDGRISTAGFLHGGAEKQFSYEYLAGTHLLEKLTMPNHMTLTQSYEIQRDLLIGMAYHRGTTLVANRQYSYDTLGHPTARNTSRQGTVKNDTFGYNNRSELTTATVNGSNYAYDYDNIGNRETATESDITTNYTANELNQYTAVGDFIPTFDDDGNQTLVKTSTGTWEVTYDAENRPVSFTNVESSTVVECAYDHMGRRATKKVTVNGAITLHQRYLYRGYLQIACCDLTRSNHPALWLITWDPTQPIATRPLAIQKDGTWYTYGWDLTKNICELYGSNGYIRTSYTYSPYGEVTESSNSVYQPIQWSSEYNDTELGLVYYNYRHYNPMAGRWLGRDKIEIKNRASNKYNYVSNCSNFRIDRLGNYDGWYIDDESWLLYNKYQDNKKPVGRRIASSNVYARAILNEAIYEQGRIKKEPNPVPTWDGAFYDIDSLLDNVSRRILNSIENKHNIVNKVIDQATELMIKKMKDLKTCACGERDWVYRTERAYGFEDVVYALGDGVVGTVSYIKHKWKEYEHIKQHGEIWWEAELTIHYSDIFEKPYMLGDYGLNWESGVPFAYYHNWSAYIENSWVY